MGHNRDRPSRGRFSVYDWSKCKEMKCHHRGLNHRDLQFQSSALCHWAKETVIGLESVYRESAWTASFSRSMDIVGMPRTRRLPIPPHSREQGKFCYATATGVQPPPASHRHYGHTSRTRNSLPRSWRMRVTPSHVQTKWFIEDLRSLLGQAPAVTVSKLKRNMNYFNYQ
jgi:hypothetical protein